MINKLTRNIKVLVFLSAICLSAAFLLPLSAEGQTSAPSASSGAAAPGDASGEAPAEGAEEIPAVPAAPVPPPQTAAPNESALDLLMRERSNDILELAQDANKMLQDARALAPEYNKNLQEADTSLGSLLRLYQLSMGWPREFVRKMTRRSMPTPMPRVGGRPVSMALRKSSSKS